MGYIDKELLIKTYCNDWCDCDPKDCYMIPEEDGGLYCSHIETILSVPEADVKPVVPAEWILLEPVIGLYECSNCEHKILRSQCNYCPNCGAYMKGEK